MPLATLLKLMVSVWAPTVVLASAQSVWVKEPHAPEKDCKTKFLLVETPTILTFFGPPLMVKLYQYSRKSAAEHVGAGAPGSIVASDTVTEAEQAPSGVMLIAVAHVVCACIWLAINNTKMRMKNEIWLCFIVMVGFGVLLHGLNTYNQPFGISISP